MNENSLTSEHTTLIERYERIYRDALKVIDNEVKDLIEKGQEMKGMYLYAECMDAISEVHKELSKLYTFIYRGQAILEHYHSKRFAQVHNNLKPTRALIDDSGHSREEIEKIVTKGIRESGVYWQNWLLNDCFLHEMEYMIKILKIIIEPEFEPVPKSENDSPQEEIDL